MIVTYNHYVVVVLLIYIYIFFHLVYFIRIATEQWSYAYLHNCYVIIINSVIYNSELSTIEYTNKLIALL